MKKLLLITILALSSLTTQCIENSYEQEANDRYNQKIQQLMSIFDMDKIYKIGSDMMWEMNKATCPISENTFKTICRKHMAGNMKAVLDLMKKYFTEEDIDLYLEFYSSTTGQKVINNMPELMIEIAKKANECNAGLIQELNQACVEALNSKNSYEEFAETEAEATEA